MEGRAISDEQKRAIIERLFSAWCALPALRLGQMIEDVFCRDIYYVEDEDFIKKIESFVDEFGKKGK